LRLPTIADTDLRFCVVALWCGKGIANARSPFEAFEYAERLAVGIAHLL